MFRRKGTSIILEATKIVSRVIQEKDDQMLIYIQYCNTNMFRIIKLIMDFNRKEIVHFKEFQKFPLTITWSINVLTEIMI
jgi:hypothetical protein